MHEIFSRKIYLLGTFHLDTLYPHTQQVRPRTRKTISSSFFVLPVTLLPSISTLNVPDFEGKNFSFEIYPFMVVKDTVNFTWDRVSKGTDWSSPDHVGAYGKDKLHRCIFALERSRSATSRDYHRIQKILTTILHTVTWEYHCQVVKGFYCKSQHQNQQLPYTVLTLNQRLLKGFTMQCNLFVNFDIEKNNM